MPVRLTRGLFLWHGVLWKGACRPFRLLPRGGTNVPLAGGNRCLFVVPSATSGVWCCGSAGDPSAWSALSRPLWSSPFAVDYVAGRRRLSERFPRDDQAITYEGLIRNRLLSVGPGGPGGSIVRVAAT